MKIPELSPSIKRLIFGSYLCKKDGRHRSNRSIIVSILARRGETLRRYTFYGVDSILCVSESWKPKQNSVFAKNHAIYFIFILLLYVLTKQYILSKFITTSMIQMHFTFSSSLQFQFSFDSPSFQNTIHQFASFPSYCYSCLSSSTKQII